MRLIQLQAALAFLLAIWATSCLAATGKCIDIPAGPLAAEAKAGSHASDTHHEAAVGLQIGIRAVAVQLGAIR